MRRLLKEVYRAYDSRLRANPLPVKMVTSGAVVCASDAVVQVYTSPEGASFSLTRTLIIGVGYGALWFAPILHGMTTMWSRVLPSMSITSLVTKSVVDMTTSFPVNVSAMLAAQAYVRGENDIKGAIERNIFASVTDGWLFWTPMSLIMYSMVPLRYRVAFLNAGSFGWNGWLAYRFKA